MDTVLKNKRLVRKEINEPSLDRSTLALSERSLAKAAEHKAAGDGALGEAADERAAVDIVPAAAAAHPDRDAVAADSANDLAAEFADLVADGALPKSRVKVPPVYARITAARFGDVALVDASVELRVLPHNRTCKLVRGDGKWLQWRWEAICAFVADAMPDAKAAESKEAKAPAKPSCRLVFDLCMPAAPKHVAEGKTADCADWTPGAAASANSRLSLAFSTAADLAAVVAAFGSSARLQKLFATRAAPTSTPAVFDSKRMLANRADDSPHELTPLARDATAVQQRVARLKQSFADGKFTRVCFRCRRSFSLGERHATCTEPLSSPAVASPAGCAVAEAKQDSALRSAAAPEGAHAEVEAADVAEAAGPARKRRRVDEEGKAAPLAQAPEVEETDAASSPAAAAPAAGSTKRKRKYQLKLIDLRDP
jgi:hypothetical protein